MNIIGRVFWIAVSTIYEMLKDKTIAGFFMVGVVLVMGGYVVAEMAVVERMRMFVDTGLSAIFIIGVMITLMVGSNVINREIRSKEVHCILSKPLPRSAWMAGKTAGFLFTMGILILGLTIFCVSYIKMFMNVWVPSLFLGAFFIYLELIILCSYTALFSTITSQYLSIFFGLLVLVIGHMVDDLRIYWASENVTSQIVSKVLFHLFPDLHSFQATSIVHGTVQMPPSMILSHSLYAFVYLTIAIAIAVFIMNSKEID